MAKVCGAYNGACQLPNDHPGACEDTEWVALNKPRQYTHEPVSPSVDWSKVAAENYDLLNEAKGRITLLEEELKRRNQDIADLQLTNRNLSRKIFEDRRIGRRING